MCSGGGRVNLSSKSITWKTGSRNGRSCSRTCVERLSKRSIKKLCNRCFPALASGEPFSSLKVALKASVSFASESGTSVGSFGEWKQMDTDLQGTVIRLYACRKDFGRYNLGIISEILRNKKKGEYRYRQRLSGCPLCKAAGQLPRVLLHIRVFGWQYGGWPTEGIERRYKELHNPVDKVTLGLQFLVQRPQQSRRIKCLIIEGNQFVGVCIDLHIEIENVNI